MRSRNSRMSTAGSRTGAAVSTDQPRDMAIAAEQRHGKAAPAFGAFGKDEAGTHHQRLDGGECRLDLGERRGKAAFDLHRRRRAARRDRHGDGPRQPGKQMRQRLAEARRQRRHVLARHPADGQQPGAAQRQFARFGQRQRGDRQVIDAVGLVASQRQCGIRRGGECRPGGQPQPRQPGDKVIDQRRLAAEQMRAAGDIEHQPMRRHRHHHRGVAIAAIGEPFEQRRIGGRIMRLRQQLGHPRPGIGEPHPRGQPGGECLPVDRGQNDRALVLLRQRQRRFRRFWRRVKPRGVGRTLAPQPLAGELRQVQGQNAAR